MKNCLFLVLIFAGFIIGCSKADQQRKVAQQSTANQEGTAKLVVQALQLSGQLSRESLSDEDVLELEKKIKTMTDPELEKFCDEQLNELLNQWYTEDECRELKQKKELMTPEELREQGPIQLNELLRVLTQARTVSLLEVAHAIPKARDEAGEWNIVSSSWDANFRQTVVRVDLDHDGLEYKNLRNLAPLLNKLPYLKELHLPAWMTEEDISEQIDMGKLRHIKVIFDIPFPA